MSKKPFVLKSSGYILMENEEPKTFKAKSPKMALKEARKILGLRSLTRKTFDKARARSIHFGGRVIFPDRRKRNESEHKNRQINKGRPQCSEVKLQMDVGRRRHGAERMVA